MLIVTQTNVNLMIDWWCQNDVDHIGGCDELINKTQEIIRQAFQQPRQSSSFFDLEVRNWKSFNIIIYEMHVLIIWNLKFDKINWSKWRFSLLEIQFLGYFFYFQEWVLVFTCIKRLLSIQNRPKTLKAWSTSVRPIFNCINYIRITEYNVFF